MNAAQFERPAEAVRNGRQLRWERRNLGLLDSTQVTWRQLRHHLYSSGIIYPCWTSRYRLGGLTKEGLRDWLRFHLISLWRSCGRDTYGWEVSLTYLCPAANHCLILVREPVG